MSERLEQARNDVVLVVYQGRHLEIQEALDEFEAAVRADDCAAAITAAKDAVVEDARRLHGAGHYLSATIPMHECRAPICVSLTALDRLIATFRERKQA